MVRKSRTLPLCKCQPRSLFLFLLFFAFYFCSLFSWDFASVRGRDLDRGVGSALVRAFDLQARFLLSPDQVDHKCTPPMLGTEFLLTSLLVRHQVSNTTFTPRPQVARSKVQGARCDIAAFAMLADGSIIQYGGTSRDLLGNTSAGAGGEREPRRRLSSCVTYD
jgi:hypothetical protein